MLDYIWNTAICSTGLFIIMLVLDIMIYGDGDAPDNYRVVGGLSITVAIVSWVSWGVGSLLA